MNKKLLLACLVLFPFSPLSSCECFPPFRTFCESIGIDSTSKIGLVKVLSWVGLERDEFGLNDPYIDVLVLESLKDLPVNDTLRIEMNNGANCAADVLDFWPGKQYVFNLQNYPHWTNQDSLIYQLSACGVNSVPFDSDSIYYFDPDLRTQIPVHYESFKLDFLACYQTQNRVAVAGKVFSLKDSQTLEGFDFYMNDQLVRTDSQGHFGVIQLMALERGLTMDSTSFNKENEALAGITIRDLVQIQRHVLDIEPFPAFWHYVAADVDLSGRVTTLDIIHLRRLLKGLTNRLPSKSWLLIPKQEFYTWPTHEEHFRMVTSRSDFLFQIPRWQMHHHPDGYDLWAIKLGDLL